MYSERFNGLTFIPYIVAVQHSPNHYQKVIIALTIGSIT